MPFLIQRVPRALLNLLSLQGGTTPAELEDRARATIDLLQCYGMTQLQLRQNANAALAEGGTVSVSVPEGETWVLFSAALLIQKTATMTALRASIQIGINFADRSAVACEELGPFGATETGSARMAVNMPYPRILPSGFAVVGSLDILGTDATANCLLTAQVGVLG